MVNQASIFSLLWLLVEARSRMRSWENSCDDANINLFTESVICCEAPDDDALAACTAMGKALAE